MSQHILTKILVAGASLAANTEVEVDVTGWGFTPEFVTACQIPHGTAADDLTLVSCYPGAHGVTQIITIVSFAFSDDTVTVKIRNNHDTTAYFWENIIITAGKNNIG